MADDSPDWQKRFRRKHAAAITRVDDLLSNGVGSRVPSKVLAQYGRRFEAGWRVNVDVPCASAMEFHVLVDAAFPYSPPRIAVPEAPAAPGWPHLERDRLLCILPADAGVSSEDPNHVVAELLDQARQLVSECVSGSNIDEFRDEFQSYWHLTTGANARQFLNLLDPTGPSRTVKVWRGRSTRVFGEDSDALIEWLARRGTVGVSDNKLGLDDAALLWLPQPPLPGEYPNNAAEVLALAPNQRDKKTIDGLVTATDSDIDILIGAQSPNGACYGGVTIPVPRQTSSRRIQRKSVQDGFRPGHIPHDLHVSRRLGKTVKIQRADVSRADHRWIHGRDRDDRQDRLRSCRIAVLGCGALGGAVAKLLAQAGVGNLLLVDPAKLDWPNLSRHTLGADSINKSKAAEVARVIREAYPHLGKIEFEDKIMGPSATDLVRDCSSCDLILSTMGNWAAESFLSDVQRKTPGFPPIVFGWLEAHAVAAHAVAIPEGKACLRCGMDETGKPQLTVAVWPDHDDTAQEPACGAVFTPYGPIDLGWGQMLVADRVLGVLIGSLEDATHSIWVGSKHHLAASNGQWSPEWIRTVGDPGEGRRIVKRQWSKTCSLCQ